MTRGELKEMVCRQKISDSDKLILYRRLVAEMECNNGFIIPENFTSMIAMEKVNEQITG